MLVCATESVLHDSLLRMFLDMQGDFDEIHALYKKQKAKLKYLQVHSGHMKSGHIPLHAHSLRSTHKWRFLLSHSEGNEGNSSTAG